MEALPKDWRHALKCYGYDRLVSFDLHEQTQLFLSGKDVLLSNADLKGIYKEFRDGEIVQLTAQKKYVEFFENDDLTGKKFTAYPTRLPSTLSQVNFNINCYTDIWLPIIF